MASGKLRDGSDIVTLFIAFDHDVELEWHLVFLASYSRSSKSLLPQACIFTSLGPKIGHLEFC